MTEKIKVIEDWGEVIDHPLMEAFEASIEQVMHGKGTRHGGDTKPFFDQPWYHDSLRAGVGGLMYQGMKKGGEACEKETQEDFERELLGAINYYAMAYLFVKRNGFKRG